MTQEQQDKQAFFGLYVWREVFLAPGEDKYPMLLKGTSDYGFQAEDTGIKLSSFYSHGHLLLKPLSAITDEDAIEVCEIFGAYYPSVENGRAIVMNIDESDELESIVAIRYIEIIDYLRSRGYLLPFRQYTTQQLLDMGWAKIKND